MKIKWFGFALALVLSSCATYQGKIAESRRLLEAGDCEGSLAKLEKLATDEGGDQLAYLMDYGAALQICHRYVDSNNILEKADRLSEANDYHSISKVTGATLLNEEMVQYKGDSFEKMFLNISKALNYLQLEKTDEAMVEVRKINEKYKKFTNEDKKQFELNSFALYLSGLIWESQKQLDDACIAYKNSYSVDPSYRKVGLDAMKVCYQANRELDYNSLLKLIKPTLEELEQIKGSKKITAELVVVYLQGMGPRKQPRLDNHLAARLVSENSNILQLQLEAEASPEISYVTEPVYDVADVATKTLETDYNALVGRRIGARVAKEVVASQVRQKDELLGGLVWLAMVASERADLRQWSLLPNSIQVARIALKPGERQIAVTGLDKSKNKIEKLNPIQVTLNPKQKKILMIRTLK